MTTLRLQLSQEPEADALLSRDPFALLLGMLLDQQMTAYTRSRDLTSRRIRAHL